MLNLHLLGHTYVTHEGRTVPISAKAIALITYLAVEKLPQHRERLADLLWNTPESRKNLRVELARIRSAGLDVFPSSHQLLHLEHVTSDFELWCARAGQDMNERELTAWLALLRGLPLTGLEDLGSPSFQGWVDQQRWLMTGQIEQHLRRAYWRRIREGQTWATRLIAERAEALGFEEPTQDPGEAAPLPPPGAAPAPPAPVPEAPVPAGRVRLGAIHFERPSEQRDLHHLFRRAEEELQLAYLHGPASSGKSYLVNRVAAQLGWALVPVSCARPGRLLVAGLAQGLLRLCEPHDGEPLGRLLLHPGSLEEDVVKVAYSLSRLRRPVLLVFDHAQDAHPEVPPLVEFLFESCAEAGRLFLVLGREPSERVPLARTLLGRVERTRCLELSLAPLSALSVQRTLEAQFPFEPARRLQTHAARLLQRSEGNPLHLLSLLAEAPDLEGTQDTRFPQPVRDTFGGEIGRWPARLHEALSRLSVIYGRFDPALAGAVLGEEPRVTEALLCEALERGILVEADPEGPLDWPSCAPVRAPAAELVPQRGLIGAGYLFQSEGLRVALASRLPQFLRQEVRRRLAAVLADSDPGLAAHYAGRAQWPEEAARLRDLYLGRLPPDSPLRRGPAGSPPPPPPLPARTPPVRLPPEVTPSLGGSPGVPLTRQDYLLTRDHGWLGVVSSARYGPPSTLTLHFTLPPASGAAPAEVQVLWRLDLYRGGEELGPGVVPFPLRVGLLGSGVAHVLTPGELSPYHEHGVRHLPHTDVDVGHWMEHRLHLLPAGVAPRTLEVSVRAVDLALTLAALRWNGQNLLHAAPAPQVRAGPRVGP